MRHDHPLRRINAVLLCGSSGSPHLRPSGGTDERQAFGAALEASLGRRLVDHPTRIDHLVGMIVLVKQGAESLRG